jgi:hypothetical protein
MRMILTALASSAFLRFLDDLGRGTTLPSRDGIELQCMALACAYPAQPGPVSFPSGGLSGSREEPRETWSLATCPQQTGAGRARQGISRLRPCRRTRWPGIQWGYATHNPGETSWGSAMNYFQAT